MGRTVEVLKQELECIKRDCGRENQDISICSKCDLVMADRETIISALTDAIDTMYKYQKIEKIISNRHYSPCFKIVMSLVEVVEDGNDD